MIAPRQRSKEPEIRHQELKDRKVFDPWCTTRIMMARLESTTISATLLP